VTEQDLAHFSGFLAPSSILSTLSPSNTPADELNAFNSDWMGKYKGKSTTVLKPRTTEEVSKIVKYCNEKRIGIVPQGGNTGLVGGSVPVRDEVIINLSNLNKVRSFDPVSGPSASPPSVRTLKADTRIRNTCGRRRLHLAVLNRLPCPA
jgi:FAD/FMN-containing dehydrogenase